MISNRRRLCSALLVGTMLGGLAAPGWAQPAVSPAPTQPQPAPAPVAAAVQPPPAPLPGTGTIRSLAVTGSQRLEPETVLSYMKLRVGQPYDREKLDEAIRDLYNTELFADVQILGADTGNIVVQVRENPDNNRILIEGNKRLNDHNINPETKHAPPPIFSRSKPRAHVAPIFDPSRRQGRIAARAEPKIVQLEQN